MSQLLVNFVPYPHLSSQIHKERSLAPLAPCAWMLAGGVPYRVSGVGRCLCSGFAARCRGREGIFTVSDLNGVTGGCEQVTAGVGGQGAGVIPCEVVVLGMRKTIAKEITLSLG